MTATSPIPVHILTGFLGSGKTTLLNRIIRSDAMADAAVIINEFGEVGLDHHLVEASRDTVIELSNGCLCCTVRGQLVETLEDLVARRPNRIIIETTGLADPVPVLQAVIASPVTQGEIQLAGMITVYDALHGAENLSAHPEALAQVLLADRIIVTKLDEITDQNRKAAMVEISSRLADLNPSADILSREVFLETAESIFSEPAPPSLINANIRNAITEAGDSHSHDHHGHDSHGHTHHHHHHHDHADDISRHSDRICTVTLRHDRPIERSKLEMFLDLLLSAHGEHVLRLKGLAYLTQDKRPLLLQAVQRSLSKPEFLNNWPSQPPRTEIVVFLSDMKPDFVERLFLGFLDVPATDTPDRQALQENPLSIPGTGSFNPV